MNDLERQIQVLNRPIKLGIIFSMATELFIFILWGLILYPEGNMVYKFLWAVVFCGIGMGAAVGAMIQLFVVGRLTGYKAILTCSLLSVVILGVACNLLCMNLDSQFHYFGGVEDPVFFIAGGAVLAAVSGTFAGWLLFSEKGKSMMDKLGM